MTENRPNIISSRRLPLPAWLDRWSARVARLPWWAIIVGAGLISVFYAFASNVIYQDALSALTSHVTLMNQELPQVAYDVRGANGDITRVSGALSAQNADTVTVMTQPDTRVTLQPGDIGKITCGADNTNTNCPVGQQVTIRRSSIAGKLIFETLGKFQIKTDDGQTIDILKITVNSATRTPDSCSPDLNGNCKVKLTLKLDRDENKITGTLLESNADRVVVQTTPPLTTTISRADIVSQVNYQVSPECALNNLTACNSGVFMTLWVTIMAFIFAIIIGLVLGLMRVSADPVLYNLSTLYVEVVRGIPLLVIILFIYYPVATWLRTGFLTVTLPLGVSVAIVVVLVVVYLAISRFFQPAILFDVIRTMIIIASMVLIALGFANLTSLQLDFREVASGILALSVCYGAYLAELFRAGIQSIGAGQMEAARSLGMSYLEAMRYIIVPQAVRVILPALGNELIAMLKDSSLLAFITVGELTYQSFIYASSTYHQFETYVTLAVLYLCMTLFLSFMVRVVERRSSIVRR